MTKTKLILFALISITLTNCTTEKHKFPIDKRYWDLNDYDYVVHELSFRYQADEKLPSFDDPQSSIVVTKLTDEQNFKVVLDDTELGLKHRNDVADKFFDEWKGMTKIYDDLDRKDQYLYDKEMIAVWHFGLGLQLKYFKLGNDRILESADDPNSSRVKNNIKANVNALVKNYLIYLDEINNEEAFTEEGKAKLAEGINTYFPELIELFPNARRSEIKNKAELLLKKSESDKIKTSLTELIELINSKNKIEST